MRDGKRPYVTVLVYVCINSFQIEKKAVRGTVQNEQKNQDVIWSESRKNSEIFFRLLYFGYRWKYITRKSRKKSEMFFPTFVLTYFGKRWKYKSRKKLGSLEHFRLFPRFPSFAPGRRLIHYSKPHAYFSTLALVHMTNESTNKYNTK